MSKSLSSYGKGSKAQKEAIIRRLANKTMGLGYWAAIDAKNKKDQ